MILDMGVTQGRFIWEIHESSQGLYELITSDLSLNQPTDKDLNVFLDFAQNIFRPL